MNWPLLSVILPVSDPTWIFFLVLCIILFAPMLLERLHIPQIIGMVLAGVAVGPYGFHLLERDMSFELFGEVGLLYIMFTAGLGMDLSDLKRNWRKSLTLGALTFSVPFAAGCLLGYFGLNYSWPAALMLAAILSSHTLVSYPIVTQYGLQRHISVTLSVGATMLALMAALFVVAGISGYYNAGGGSIFWLWLIVKCAAFCAGVWWLYPKLIRLFFRHFADNVMQFVFVLALVFLSAGLSKACGLQGIFGAFLAGIVFNRYIPGVSPLMTRINFVGNALFIPYFLIGVGMLINVRILFEQPSELLVVLLIVAVATLTKAMAARAEQAIYKMDRTSGLMMFGLTEAHAAGALAIVIVGTRLQVGGGTYLMSDEVLNAVVMLILFSCIISSLATQHAARRIALTGVSREEKVPDDNVTLISFSNPETIEPLVQVALLMRNTRSNKPLIGINVVVDGEDSMRRRAAGIEMLNEATRISAAADVKMKTGVRMATNVASALIHAAKEYEVSTLLLGLHQKQSLLDSFFGPTIETLFKGMERQIAIVRCHVPPNTVRCMHVVVPRNGEKEYGFRHWLGAVLRMAVQLDCRIVFHADQDVVSAIENFAIEKYAEARLGFEGGVREETLPMLAGELGFDHLLVFISARKGGLSYEPSFEQLPTLIEKYFGACNIMTIYPEQLGIENAQRLSFHAGLSKEDAYADFRLHSWMEER